MLPRFLCCKDSGRGTFLLAFHIGPNRVNFKIIMKNNHSGPFSGQKKSGGHSAANAATRGGTGEEGGLRLNKAISGAGICSRRQADRLVEEGRVKVNGEITRELGLRLEPGDRLEVDGKVVNFAPDASRPFCYFMLHKPVQVVSTAHDPEGRQTVLDFLPPHLAGRRLYPVGRLDYFSEGLILLTDDGELTNRLTHPKHHLPKIYVVDLREEPTPEQIRIMRSGMTLAEGEKLAPVEIKTDPARPTRLEMTLRQGVNRQIRRMFRDFGLTILRLRRVGQGPLRLADLPKGQGRELNAAEIAELRKAAGL